MPHAKSSRAGSPASDQIGDAMVTQLNGDAVEVTVSTDMVKRGLMIAPVLIALSGIIWGVKGVWSAMFAIALVLVNFMLSSRLIAYTAKISLGLMMGAAMFGYILRLGLIMVAILLVRDQPWISLPALGATIIVTHLGLLIWELKYLSISLAYPGLKPTR